ncbi:hypothetical protein FRC02_012370 [Tulasnella sp. 418]|nr:hypothetical protein FRC02_012370 [Tulasnella sp. 418]
MHRALTIDEIVRLICIYSAIERRMDLLSVALTCKAFTQPALDYLWEACMTTKEIFWPMVVWGVLNRDRYGLELARNPTEEDWNRYAQYAVRVRDVNISSDDLSLKARSSLLAKPREKLMFPRVQYLTISFGSIMNQDIATLFISPLLRTLKLACRGSTSVNVNLQPFLSELVTTSTQIERVEMDLGSLSGSESGSTVSSFLSSSPALKSISIFAPPHFFPYIILSPSDDCAVTELSLMTIHRWDTRLLVQNVHPIRIPALPNLKRLTIQAPFANIDTETLAHATSAFQLAMLSLVLEPRDVEGGKIGAILKGIAERRSPVTLAGLNLIPMYHNFHPRAPVCSEDVAILSTGLFANLYLLMITGLVAYDIQDDDLRLIAKGCPGLHIFHLITLRNRVFRPTPIITLKGLITFARELEDLRSVTLPVNAFPMPIEIDPQNRVPLLSGWNISYSQAKEPDQVVDLLRRHLPKLKSIHASQGDQDIWENSTLIAAWEGRPSQQNLVNERGGKSNPWQRIQSSPNTLSS